MISSSHDDVMIMQNLESIAHQIVSAENHIDMKIKMINDLQKISIKCKDHQLFGNSFEQKVFPALVSQLNIRSDIFEKICETLSIILPDLPNGGSMLDEVVPPLFGAWTDKTQSFWTVADKCMCDLLRLTGITSFAKLLLSYFESPVLGDVLRTENIRKRYQEKGMINPNTNLQNNTFFELLSSKITEEIKNPNLPTDNTSLYKIQEYWPELNETIQTKLNNYSSTSKTEVISDNSTETTSTSEEQNLRWIPEGVYSQSEDTSEEDEILISEYNPIKSHLWTSTQKPQQQQPSNLKRCSYPAVNLNVLRKKKDLTRSHTWSFDEIIEDPILSPINSATSQEPSPPRSLNYDIIIDEINSQITSISLPSKISNSPAPLLSVIPASPNSAEKAENPQKNLGSIPRPGSLNPIQVVPLSISLPPKHKRVASVPCPLDVPYTLKTLHSAASAPVYTTTIKRSPSNDVVIGPDSLLRSEPVFPNYDSDSIIDDFEVEIEDDVVVNIVNISDNLDIPIPQSNSPAHNHKTNSLKCSKSLPTTIQDDSDTLIEESVPVASKTRSRKLKRERVISRRNYSDVL